MKKLIFLLCLNVFLVSCSASMYQTKHQSIVMRKFSKKKHLRSFNSETAHRYVPARKRGDIVSPPVTRTTRREMIRRIKSQKHTISD